MKLLVRPTLPSFLLLLGTCGYSEEVKLTSEETADGQVSYILYNSKLPNGTMITATDETYLRRLFKNVKCSCITHGWIEDSTRDSVMNLINAFLQKSDLNLIVVDWKSLARNPFYIASSLATEKVGNAVCELLIKLDRLSICKVEETYAIGHSLGAHLMSILGSCVQEKIKKQLARITGLDPAGPNYNENLRSEDVMLDRSDAKFVDAIHTDNHFGLTRGVGHVDFWVNGGRALQPGCNPIRVFCSHRRSHELFAESIYNTSAFPSVYCNSHDNFMSGICDDNVMLHMGLSSERDFIRLHGPQGDYYVNTNNESPYSK